MKYEAKAAVMTLQSGYFTRAFVVSVIAATLTVGSASLELGSTVARTHVRARTHGRGIPSAAGNLDDMTVEELRKEAHLTLKRQKELVKRYHKLTEERNEHVRRGDVDPDDPPTNSATSECALPPDTNSACPPKTGATRTLMQQAQLTQQLKDQTTHMQELMNKLAATQGGGVHGGNPVSDITSLQSHMVSVQSRSDQLWRDVSSIQNDVNLQQGQIKNEINMFKMSAGPSQEQQEEGQAPPVTGLLEEDEGATTHDVLLQTQATTRNNVQGAIDELKGRVSQVTRRLDRIQRAISETSATIQQNIMKNQLDMNVASEQVVSATQEAGRQAQEKELQKAAKEEKPAAPATTDMSETPLNSLSTLAPLLEMMEKNQQESDSDRREEEKLHHDDEELEEQKAATSQLESNVQNALSRVNNVIREGEKEWDADSDGDDDDDVSLLQVSESTSAPRRGKRSPRKRRHAHREARHAPRNGLSARPIQDMGAGSAAADDSQMSAMFDELAKRQKQELMREATEMERETAFEQTQEMDSLSADDRADGANVLNNLVAQEEAREQAETQREKAFATQMKNYESNLKQQQTSLEEEAQAEGYDGNVDVSQVSPEMTEPKVVSKGEAEAEGEGVEAMMDELAAEESEGEAEGEGDNGHPKGEAEAEGEGVEAMMDELAAEESEGEAEGEGDNGHHAGPATMSMDEVPHKRQNSAQFRRDWESDEDSDWGAWGEAAENGDDDGQDEDDEEDGLEGGDGLQDEAYDYEDGDELPAAVVLPDSDY